MVAAVIFAGGVGARMKSADIPKQFIEVDGKPIIIRTLEIFSQHPEIDKICISCLESWIDVLKEQIEQYGIKKVEAIVPGGSNGYESIHNGLMAAAEGAQPDDLVLICDGVRPMISGELVSNCIRETKEYGSAVPVTPSIDSVLESKDGVNCSRNYPRSEMFITQAPQGFTFEKILWAHEEAEKRNITNPTSSCELLIELGETVHIFIGERQNIKVTTPEDLYTLRSHYYYQHYRRFAQEEFKYEM
ncbi:MAG: 2-C-methyl-D-erythritol 4-phosphate cytidylyltransferase [Lachnospiraceae bacterium]